MREEFAFEGFRIHEGNCVMVLHYDVAEVLAPNSEHGGIYDIRKATLWIIS